MATDYFLRPTQGVVETLEFLTDIQVALSGKELRSPKRAAPRLTYTLNQFYEEGWNTVDMENFLSDRNDSLVRIPAACHLIERGDFYGDTSTWPAIIGNEFNNTTMAGTGMNYVFWKPDGSYVIQPFSQNMFTDPIYAGWYHAAPVLNALPDSVQTYTKRMEKVFQAAIKFEVHDFVEALPTGWYTKAGIKTESGTWDFFHNWLDGEPTFSSNDVVDKLDNGNVPFIWPTKRFSKKKISVQQTLTSRADILRFRNFIYTCQGACNAFYFKNNDFETTQFARLASDTVEIQYISPVLAKVSLELILVDN